MAGTFCNFYCSNLQIFNFVSCLFFSPLDEVTIKWYKMAAGSNVRQDITSNSETNKRKLNILTAVTGDRYVCEAEMTGEPTITGTTTIQVISMCSSPSVNSKLESWREKLENNMAFVYSTLFWMFSVFYSLVFQYLI